MIVKGVIEIKDAEVIDLKNFKKNPVVLFDHNYDQVIGKAKSIRRINKELFAELDLNVEAVCSLTDLPLYPQIGVAVIEFNEEEKIEKAELLEVSLSPAKNIDPNIKPLKLGG